MRRTMLALVACVALMLGLAVTPQALAAPAVASAPAVQDSARLPDKHAIALDTWNWIPASGWIKCNYLSSAVPKWTNFRIEIQHNAANTSRRITSIQWDDADAVGYVDVQERDSTGAVVSLYERDVNVKSFITDTPTLTWFRNTSYGQYYVFFQHQGVSAGCTRTGVF
jgi:hypothetical protein